MRSLNFVRLTLCAVVCVILAVVALASVSAQSATPTPTVNPMVATMVLEQGSCPQGQAQTLLASMMSMTEEPTAEAAASTSAPATTASTGTITSMKCLSGQFSGAAEVPGPGASNAQGVVLLSIHGSTGNICYEVAVANITLPATELHLDKGNAGKAGNMAVSFHPRPDKSGVAVGCVTVGPALATDIESHPSDYYVNVFTTDFKNGAARAQLSDWNPTMHTTMATPQTAATAEATAAVKGA